MVKEEDDRSGAEGAASGSDAKDPTGGSGGGDTADRFRFGGKDGLAVDLMQVLDCIPDGITIQNRSFEIIYQNATMRSVFGPQLGAKCYVAYEKRDRICEGCGISKAFETGRPTLVLRTAFDRQGETSYWENHCFPIFDESGAIYAGAEICRNISGRVSLEEEVKRRNIDLGQLTTVLHVKTEQLGQALSDREAAVAQLRTTLTSIGDGLISTDLRGCVSLMNPIAERLTGWRFEEAKGRPIAEVFHLLNPRTAAAATNPVELVLRQGVIGQTDHRLIARDGTSRHIADSCAPILDDRSELIGAVLVFRDVTEEHQQRERLRESEEKYRTLFEGAGEGILVTDVASQSLRYCNRKWCEMFGYAPDQVPEIRLRDIYLEHPDAVSKDEPGKSPQGGRRVMPDLLCRRKDGSSFIADVHTTTLHMDGELCFISFFADASERREYEERLLREKAMREKAEVELRHSQKLQAVGQLAAGIAHEINTPSQFVGDSLQYLADAYQELEVLIGKYRRVMASLPPTTANEKLREEIGRAEDQADLEYLLNQGPQAFSRALDGMARIAAIVGAMKEFAHPDRREKSPADLNRALETTLVIAKNEYKYVADVETDLGELPPVQCHLSDLNQVFLNLLVNAAHSIGDVVRQSSDRGTIRVRTAWEGQNVRIEFSDTGTGIPEEIRDRLFEPFFTTKDVGMGSGQGLAIAHSIVVDKHGGSLTFDSTVGGGTTFTIILPVEGSRSSLPDRLPESP